MNIYCQGQIVDETKARISASDHGFLYGASLFETFRTYNGKPLLLEKHLERLMDGCRAFGIVPQSHLLLGHAPDHFDLRKILRDLLDANGLRDAVFRYTISAGESPGGLPDSLYRNATELIYVRSLPSSRKEGDIRLHVLTTTRTEPEVLPRPKSGHYMNSLAGYRELRQRASDPGDEGLMLTADGRLAEGVASNLFLILKGKLVTPPPSAHILSGITRGAVLDLAHALEMEPDEMDLRLDDLTGAEAIFTTNSVRGIQPVSAVLDKDGRTLWKRKTAENRIVSALSAAYAGLHAPSL